MNTVIIGLSRYALVFFIAFYAFHCFMAFAYGKEGTRNWFYFTQNAFMIFIHVTGLVVIAMQTGNKDLYVACALQEVLFLAVIALYYVIYPNSSRLLINNMCMFLAISFVILSRLSVEKAMKQFIVVAVSLIITMIIPVIIERFKNMRVLTYIFGTVGVLSLLTVMLLGAATNGSKLSYDLFGITFQPSEFVKILFVLFEAGMLTDKDEKTGKIVMRPDPVKVVTSAIVAAAYVVILVLSRDLGSGLIFFVVYIFMLYASLKAPLVLLGGAGSGILGSVIGYKLFSHVRTRVIAWRDPFKVIEGQGYQITQSLFAIGTGGWFGMGLTLGSPDRIPVVERDFIFSAISEELGCIFSICLILICISTFLIIMNVAMMIENPYYKLIALGLAVNYAFQVFLTVGGVTKFIPLTGVTLPLVSYGGSSVLATLIVFSIVQGIYLLHKEG